MLLGESEIYTTFGRQYPARAIPFQLLLFSYYTFTVRSQIRSRPLSLARLRFLSFGLFSLFFLLLHDSVLSPGIRSYLFSNTFTFTTRQLHRIFRKLFALQIWFLLLWWCDFFHKKISFRLFLRYVVCALFPLVTVCLPLSVFNHKLITNFFSLQFPFFLLFNFFPRTVDSYGARFIFACVITVGKKQKKGISKNQHKTRREK